MLNMFHPGDLSNKNSGITLPTAKIFQGMFPYVPMGVFSTHRHCFLLAGPSRPRRWTHDLKAQAKNGRLLASRRVGACLTKTLFDANAQGIHRDLDVVEFGPVGWAP